MGFNLVLLATVLAVVSTEVSALPRTVLGQLLQKRDRYDPIGPCPDNPSAAALACVQPLEFMAHPASGMQLDKVDDAAALDYVCSMLAEAYSCLRDVHQCGREDKLTRVILRSVNGVGEHVCTQSGREVILGEAECWENKQVEGAVEVCAKDPSVRRERNPCNAISLVRNCTRDLVESLCNSRAANFVDGLLYAALNPIASEFLHCDLHERIARSILGLLPPIKK